MSGPLATWPYRIFLDSNALQALHEHGGAVFDGEEFDGTGARSGADAEDVRALSGIFHPGLRDAFELALSVNSIREVADAGDSAYLQWAFDVLDYWDAVLREGGPPMGWGRLVAHKLDGPEFGYLSKDRALIRDALLLEWTPF